MYVRISLLPRLPLTSCAFRRRSFFLSHTRSNPLSYRSQQ
jgi:hypothetical protein